MLSQNITTGAGPVSVKLADLGTDGILDLAVANYNGDTFTACTGNALGVFSFCSINNPAGGTNPISITAGDYVGNGTKAMATALSGSNAVNVFNNNVAVGVFPNAIETADFNSDGKPDMITANSGSNDVSILLNSCSAAKGNLFDYNGDRKTDYSVFRPSTTQYFVQTLNQFGAAKVLGRPNDVLVPADFNGDRKTDFAYYRPESGLWVVQENSFGFGRPIIFCSSACRRTYLCRRIMTETGKPILPFSGQVKAIGTFGGALTMLSKRSDSVLRATNRSRPILTAIPSPISRYIGHRRAFGISCEVWTDSSLSDNLESQKTKRSPPIMMATARQILRFGGRRRAFGTSYDRRTTIFGP